MPRSTVRADPGTGTDRPPLTERQAAPDVLLAYRPPYDVAALLRFFATHPMPGIEQVAGRSVRRSVRPGTLADAAGWIEVEFLTTAPLVRLAYAPQLAEAGATVVAAVRRWLDLDASPQTIDTALADLPGPPGLRLPGSLDPFEIAVRAVLGQQVTVAAGGRLAHRLIDRFGTPLETPWPEQLNRLFPAPPVLAVTAVERIAELGIIRSRAGAIVALARQWPAIVDGPSADDDTPFFDTLVTRLDALPGIGPWTAHYIAMRGFGWPDAFPPNDVAVLKAMRQRFGTTTPREAGIVAQRWRPWRAYAVLRLWNSLGAPGEL